MNICVHLTIQSDEEDSFRHQLPFNLSFKKKEIIIRYGEISLLKSIYCAIQMIY